MTGGSDPTIDQGSIEGYDTDWHLMTVVHQGKYDDLDPAAWTYDLGALRLVVTRGLMTTLCQVVLNFCTTTILKIQWDKLLSL